MERRDQKSWKAEERFPAFPQSRLLLKALNLRTFGLIRPEPVHCRGLKPQSFLAALDGTAEEAAEKGGQPASFKKRHPAGAKALLYFQSLAARLMPCPDTNPPKIHGDSGFSASSEAEPFQSSIHATSSRISSRFIA
jgi:hypothetical protein